MQVQERVIFFVVLLKLFKNKSEKRKCLLQLQQALLPAILAGSLYMHSQDLVYPTFLLVILFVKSAKMKAQ